MWFMKKINNTECYSKFEFIEDCAKNTANSLGSVVSTSEGLKTLAKITRSSAEAVRLLQQTYSGSANPMAASMHMAANNLHNMLSVFDPVIIIKELVAGDQEGKRPWDYFKERTTIPKGLSWVLKKTSICIEFTKYLHNIQAINIAASLTPCNMIKNLCDIGFASITILDRGLIIHKANRSIAHFKEKHEKWSSIKRNYENTGGYIEWKKKDAVTDINKKIEQIDWPKHQDFSQVKKLLTDYMLSVEEKPFIELEQAINHLPMIKAFIDNPENNKWRQKYLKWKTLDTYANFEEKIVSSDVKTRTIKKYFVNKIERTQAQITNQKSIQKKSALMIAFAVSLLALGILSFAGLVANFTTLPYLLLGAALISNSIGFIRFSSDSFIKVKKVDEFPVVKLPNIRCSQL